MNKFIELNEYSSIINTLPQLSKDEQTPFIHLYRAEIGRLVVYKQRLDTTINWTLTINLFIWSIIFSNGVMNSIPIYYNYFLSNFIIFIFHCIDARRYINYDEVKRRCNLMEVGMYACIINESDCYKDWKKDLCRTWTHSNEVRISFKNSMIRRCRNIFIYIYLLQIVYIIIYCIVRYLN